GRVLDGGGPDGLSLRIEDRDSSSRQSLLKRVVRAIEDRDAIDRERLAQIELPPRILLGGGVRRRSGVVVAVRRSVDRESGRPFEVRARLARLAAPGDVLATLVDLDLGERKDSSLAGEIDAHVAASRWARLPRHDARAHARDDEVAVPGRVAGPALRKRR